MSDLGQNAHKHKVETYLKKKIDEKSTIEDFCTFPQHFEIETINTCNARCTMCTIEDWDRPLVRMSDQLFEDIAHQLVPHRDSIKDISLYKDCEPLIDKKLPARIAYMKSLGLQNVGISTNVSLLDEKNATKILEAGIDKIILSIDSLKKEVFENIRLRLDFDVVLENALRFIELRNKINPATRIRVRMIELPENVKEWKEYHAFWSPKLSENDICDMRSYHNWGGQLESAQNVPKIDFSKLPCVSLWSNMVIHANGDVPLCSVDFHKLHPLGDVNKQSIQEIWQSNVVTNFRRLHATEARSENNLCKSCNVWDDMDTWLDLN